ncbi:glycosyltransferase family 4 protein [Anaeromyxobacter paludicola]|uniref:Glycosyl transferase n=1 Tax=Anaeromyxobacter paludicola TaxID=2918171 RepID=A0ABN6N2Q5_9BACT|nr:glycosyltransferase family 4 protein [Anaeromyxobacter paludicola]BDG07479.1 glycosyl transferase [Anaeromyxobacter paludicola]
MRVLLTADTVGGVFTYAAELSRALLARGVEVELATLGAPLSVSQRRALAGLRGLGLHESAFRLEWMDDPWDDVARAGEWLLALEARLRPDVVHLGQYAPGALPFAAPKVVVGHSCVLSWFEAVRGAPAPAAFDRYRAEVRRGLGAAGRVVAPSRAMLRALVRHHGPLPPARVVPNGRDAGGFRPAAKRPFVLAAGRLWDEAKNLAALDALASRLPWPVYLAGDVAEPGSERRLESGGGALLLGRLSSDELATWLGRAAVYALPARYEPFGLSILEAALSGCALVLGDVESLRENWEDSALFAPPDDPEALGAALRRLAADDDLRARLAGRARARAARFTPEAMAEGYLAVYRELLEPRAAEAPCAP